MFKKSKKFVITGLVAGAMIAGGSFAAASYYFGTNDAKTSTLVGVIENLNASMTRIKGVVADLTGQLQASSEKHATDMKSAQSAVDKANAQIVAANDAIEDANTAVNGEDGVVETASSVETDATTAKDAYGTKGTSADAQSVWATPTDTVTPASSSSATSGK